jgi:uncharacterized RDD family membrane protein YckC
MPPPGYPLYQQDRMGWQYASFGARLGALIIDGLIGIVFVIPSIIALLAGPREIRTCTINDELRLCNLPTGPTIALGVLLAFAGLIIYAFIYCRMVSRGQSWGHKATGIRVVDQNTGQSVTAWRVFGRHLARIVSSFVCYLGYFWMLWDSRKQTWHDKIAGTVVVKA